ncbi:MAG: hypothetical protein M4579_004697, partial [Chaenotheca gracillima]
MAPYLPVYVGRSDGKTEIVSKKRKERNEPTEEQLDNSPDANGVCDFYKKLAGEEPKELDWRRKLGEMLMKEVGSKEHNGKNFILAAFPSNYRLYEHLKQTVAVDPSGRPPAKSPRNHAKGPNDRQDAYLYGHPLGRKKRYRSPADFFPHLLWLATDDKGDPGNCSCKLCSPDEFQTLVMPEAEGVAAKKGDKGKKKEAAKKTAVSAVSAAKVPGPASPSTSASTATPPTTAAPATASTRPSGNNMSRRPSQDIPKQQQQPPPQPTQRPPPQQQQQPPQQQQQQPPPQQKQAIKPSPSPAPLAPTPPAVKALSANVPTPLPPLRSREQQVDSQFGEFLFRPGELVWFNRGNAWGLAVILRREKRQNQYRYLVQPLSHPYAHPDPKIITEEASLRPWLAWSAPGPTHQLLAGGGLGYDTVDWAAVLQGQLGPGDAEVDGSIFAARAIDESYTLFDQIESPNAAAGETYWNGIFLGGEKVWVGDAIRLRLGSGQEIMVLHDIIERTRMGFAGQSSAAGSTSNPASSSTVFLVGDIYLWSTVSTAVNAPPPENPHLPGRMQMDLRYRNAATQPTRNTVGFWKLMQARARLNLQDIKGRWYESTRLLPILRGEADYIRDRDRGEINDTGAWMNGRCDALGMAPGATPADRVGYKRVTRREAFGRAVRPETQVGRGLDGPAEPSLF